LRSTPKHDLILDSGFSGLAKRIGSIAAFTLNVGNTHCRLVGWRGNGTISSQRIAPTKSILQDAKLLQSILNSGAEVVLAGVVPVVKAKLAAKLRDRQRVVRVFRRDLKPQISIVPKPPARVGDDRIAAALGALSLDPKRPWVVVDAGTAMTVNAVTPGGKGRRPRFEGGLIVPGRAMSLKALAHFTAQLPDLTEKEFRIRNSFIGRNTEEAMLLGVYQATLAAAVELTKGQLRALGTRARIAVTGGGMAGLQDAFKREFPQQRRCFVPNLVDLGLFSCWKHASHT
jgi:pantothenate kinase type III